MHFQINEVSIQLMPAGDKDKDKEKDKGDKGNRPGPHPEPDRLGTGDPGGCGQTCTAGTGIGTAKNRMSSDVTQNLAFLQAQLRETLSVPPL